MKSAFIGIIGTVLAIGLSDIISFTASTLLLYILTLLIAEQLRFYLRGRSARKATK